MYPPHSQSPAVESPSISILARLLNFVLGSSFFAIDHSRNLVAVCRTIIALVGCSIVPIFRTSPSDASLPRSSDRICEAQSKLLSCCQTKLHTTGDAAHAHTAEEITAITTTTDTERDLGFWLDVVGRLDEHPAAAEVILAVVVDRLVRLVLDGAAQVVFPVGERFPGFSDFVTLTSATMSAISCHEGQSERGFVLRGRPYSRGIVSTSLTQPCYDVKLTLGI